MGYFISTLSPEDELEVEIYFENTSFGCQRSPHWGSSGSTGELASIDKRREKVGRKSSTAPLESNVEDVLFHRGRWFGGGGVKRRRRRRRIQWWVFRSWDGWLCEEETQPERK